MIYQGDALEVLRTMADGSVRCVITSPPYWALRSYLADDDPLKPLEIGTERTPEEYIARLVAVFREVRRVLAKDGTLWINIADCFATGAGAVGEHPGGGPQGARWKGTAPSSKSTLAGNGHVGGGPKLKALAPVNRGIHTAENSGKNAPVVAAMGPMTQPNRMPLPGLKPKDLIGLPWMLAFALRDDGWYLRADNIWEKPNAMPSSVKDRTTRSHEYVFHFSRSERYYYNAAAIQEPFSESVKKRPETNVFNDTRPDINGYPHAKDRRGAITKQDAMAASGSASTKRQATGFNERFDLSEGSGLLPAGRNKRSVWTIPTQPSSLPHYAMMPEELVLTCLLAGSEPGDTVLDPFSGMSTVGVVAEKAARKFIGIELSKKYAALAEKRIGNVAPLFSESAS